MHDLLSTLKVSVVPWLIQPQNMLFAKCKSENLRIHLFLPKTYPGFFVWVFFLVASEMTLFWKFPDVHRIDLESLVSKHPWNGAVQNGRFT